ARRAATIPPPKRAIRPARAPGLRRFRGALGGSATGVSYGEEAIGDLELRSWGAEGDDRSIGTPPRSEVWTEDPDATRNGVRRRGEVGSDGARCYHRGHARPRREVSVQGGDPPPVERRGGSRRPRQS